MVKALTKGQEILQIQQTMPPNIQRVFSNRTAILGLKKRIQRSKIVSVQNENSVNFLLDLADSAHIPYQLFTSGTTDSLKI